MNVIHPHPSRGGQKLFGAVLLAACLAGCASSNVNKADLPGDTNVSAQIDSLDTQIQQGVQADQDVLAPEEFAKAEEHLTTAKKEVARKASLQKILDNVSYSQSYLDKAKEITSERRPHVAGVVDARDAALKAGARDTKEGQAELKRLDNQLRRNVASLTRATPDLDTLNGLQQGYQSLELASLQHSKLQEARDLITRAQSRGAEKRAPRTLAQAQRSLINAENVIAADRHNEEAISPAVSAAQNNAQLAVDVVDMVNTHGKIAEPVALEMVQQQQTNSNLNQQLANKQDELNQSQSQLLATDADRATLEKDRALNEAIEKARKEFSSDEAEAYRQGDKLLIRLKKVNFASGRSDLPADSLPLLAKVTDVIKGLNSQQITVEGHTDSTGKSSLNKKLSQQRASAVAKYFETSNAGGSVEAVGVGDGKPLATNKTKSGRAENRRVDVIVTPGSGQTQNM